MPSIAHQGCASMTKPQIARGVQWYTSTFHLETALARLMPTQNLSVRPLRHSFIRPSQQCISSPGCSVGHWSKLGYEHYCLGNKNCTIVPRSCSWYQNCLESTYQCGSAGYPLAYGLTYCAAYLTSGTELLSPAGIAWRDNVRTSPFNSNSIRFDLLRIQGFALFAIEALLAIFVPQDLLRHRIRRFRYPCAVLCFEWVLRARAERLGRGVADCFLRPFRFRCHLPSHVHSSRMWYGTTPYSIDSQRSRLDN